MLQLTSIVQYLDSLLKPEDYKDAAVNGLQVESSSQTIQKVCVAVDAGLSVIEQAISESADLLIVHHGLFWGSQPAPITGVLSKKIELLLKHGCSLYASHLPLDGSSEVGNAFELGRYLGLKELVGFCEYGGSTIGARGKAQSSLSIVEVAEPLKKIPGAIEPLSLSFGNQAIEDIAIVTGSGSLALELCASQGVDLLISGEPKQECYHVAKELGVNALFAGHYATETFGVRAIAARLTEQFDLPTCFLDEPTGI